VSVLNDFAVGLAGLIDAADIATYDEDGYEDDSTDVCIVLKGLTQAPSRLLAITVYAVSDDAELNDSTIGVQFRTRAEIGDSTSAADIDDALFDLFQGMHDATVNGVRLVLFARQSSSALPPDETERDQHVSTYYAQIAWPTAQRVD
jgi:hypothetical protein